MTPVPFFFFNKQFISFPGYSLVEQSESHVIVRLFRLLFLLLFLLLSCSWKKGRSRNTELLNTTEALGHRSFAGFSKTKLGH